MSDQIPILIGTIFTGMMGYFMLRQEHRARAAAIEVQRVADRLAVTDSATDAKLKNIARVVDVTHTLSNSKMGEALLTISKLSQRLAVISNNPTDAALAEEAKKKYEAHQRQQDKVDKEFPEGIPPAS